MSDLTMRISRRRFVVRSGMGLAGLLALGFAAPVAYSDLRNRGLLGPKGPPLIAARPLPDSAPGRAPPGFTGTGLDRIARGDWSGYWVVGDDGRLKEGDGSPLRGAIHIVAPDWSRVVATIPGAPGASLQGVAVDRSGEIDTVWAACSATGTVRRYDLYGEDAGRERVADRIDLADFGIAGSANGLAIDLSTDTVLVSLYQGNKVYRIGRETERLVETITLGVEGTNLDSTPDHLVYDAPSRRLFYSVGRNGRNGSIRSYDLAGGRDVVAFANLDQCQAIEGFYIDADHSLLTVVSDGGFHVSARPPRNQALTYRIGLPKTVAAG
ncbi:hypothetical protein LB518_02145 [Mesorhizobium sp. BR1-1-16]|uniref:YncE family protein n=1 Tax=Mesorhizobium sp. BR1-1-16 TaxID=2876653 RepID=UPI001CC9DDF8|nr:hypothetical protein [Mesorhizobium sp. BR1-1-16]MBZ9935079.1 hypothetical protein [Mesorhizobium sp. BR1-1-16]